MGPNPTAWRQREKETFRRQVLQTKDAATRIRFLVIPHTVEGYTQPQVGEMLACSVGTVARVQQRFREDGN